MKQMTIRGIPEEVEKVVKKEAERKGLSLNRAFISVLERAATGKSPDKKKRVLHHDLDHLAGLWSREESAAFENSLKGQRKVDEELWKKAK
jgi:hypothetical protein